MARVGSQVLSAACKISECPTWSRGIEINDEKGSINNYKEFYLRSVNYSEMKGKDKKTEANNFRPSYRLSFFSLCCSVERYKVKWTEIFLSFIPGTNFNNNLNKRKKRVSSGNDWARILNFLFIKL